MHWGSFNERCLFGITWCPGECLISTCQVPGSEETLSIQVLSISVFRVGSKESICGEYQKYGMCVPI